ncbi:MAG: hypothetical protein N2B57_06855 [Planctomycetales bacterium]
MAACTNRFLWVWVALLVLVPQLHLHAADSILRRGANRSLKGEVISQNPNQVVVKTKIGIDEEIPVNEIKVIRFDVEPDALKSARSKFLNGSHKQVVDILGNVSLDEIERSLVRQDVQYLQAVSTARLALGGIGSAAKAAKMMQRYLKDYPQSYHEYEANELLGDLAIAIGKPEKADAFYKKAAAPWPESKMRLALSRGRGLAAQKKHEDAVNVYQTILDSSEQGALAQRYRLAATLGKASAMAEGGQGEQGVDDVKRVIRAAEKGDLEIHALAYNALGNCYLAMQQPKEAVLQYLHTDTLYFQDPRAHAEALGRLAQLWDQLNQPERATRARKTLNARYPNSAWNQ